MDGWSGFSDEDLRRFKHSSVDHSRPLKDKSLLRDSSKAGQVRPNQSKKSLPNAISANKLQKDYSLLPGESLSTSTVTAADTKDDSQKETARISEKKRTTRSASNEASIQQMELTGTGVSNLTNSNNDSEKAPLKEGSQATDGEGDLILDEQFILKHEIADLEKFREHQKMIEEQNKKKKEMLTAAIQERQKKAKAEATKLIVIKRELDRLDQMVNADVSVIRYKIEDISRDFLEAKKRYDRAEKEFVEAKVDLHKKALQKEQLTEHLYTVIHQNEQRKAKKLSELMNKLEMEGAGDDLLDDDTQSPPVPICHISATETRKGCLQSLGLSLIRSSQETATDAGSEPNKNEVAVVCSGSEGVITTTENTVPDCSQSKNALPLKSDITTEVTMSTINGTVNNTESPPTADTHNNQADAHNIQPDNLSSLGKPQQIDSSN